MRIVRTFFRLLGMLLLIVGPALAQDVPYSPLTAFTGAGTGYNFRQAADDGFCGQLALEPLVLDAHNANLPSEHNGALLLCKDCAETTPCTSGGLGVWGFRRRRQWPCGYSSRSGSRRQRAQYHRGVACQTTKGSVETKTDDANWRELLTPGTGVQITSRTAAYHPAIDESATISSHVNGVINVKAPPYRAKGDGTTDDTTAINNAISASCAHVPPRPVVYLPTAPVCYKTSAPILQSCSMGLTGTPASFIGGSYICQHYFGPTIITQAAETRWEAATGVERRRALAIIAHLCKVDRTS